MPDQDSEEEKDIDTIMLKLRWKQQGIFSGH